MVLVEGIWGPEGAGEEGGEGKAEPEPSKVTRILISAGFS